MDVEKAKKDMDMFAAINEQRLYRLYKACVDIQTDLQTLVKSRVSLEDLFYDIVQS
jgi:sister-chromatid-cohesion protein PDS5